MKQVKNYQNYLEDLILESFDEFQFIISSPLKEILRSINHPISDKILDDQNHTTHKKITYLDIVEDEYDMWYFVNSNKLFSTAENDYPDQLKNYKQGVSGGIDIITYIIKKNKSIIVDKIKSKIRIGRLINKLYPKEFTAQQIESFTKEYASVFQTDIDVKIVEGKDIIHFYNENSYINETNTATLHNSCMRYQHCGEYIKFYAINPDHVKMVILLDGDDNTKIRARALLWKLDKIDDNDVSDKYFMDRIYYTKNKDLIKMISFAKSNKFFYKKEQNSSNQEEIVDTTDNNKLKNLKMEVYGMNYDKNLLFPFVDTLYYYNPFDKIITNKDNVDKNEYTELGSTNGKTYIIWSDRYKTIINSRSNKYVHSQRFQEYLKIEDAVKVITNRYGEHYYLPKEMKDLYVWSEFSQGFFPPPLCEYLEKYKTYIPKFDLDRYFVWSEFYTEYFKKEDAVYSIHMEDYIPKSEAIKVYTEPNKNQFYWAIEDDPSGVFYKSGNDYYDERVSKEDIKNLSKK